MIGIIVVAVVAIVTIVVRHELWPCFLYEASKRSKVFLINASLKSKNNRSIFMKKILLEFVDKIFAVSELEKEIFCKSFSLSEERVQVSGDSKYDRVLERVANLKKSPPIFLELSGSKRKLIVGSAWRQDCEVLLGAFARYKLENSERLQIIVAPHQPTTEFLSWLAQFSQKLQISYKLFSHAKEDLRDVDLIIVDSIGILFDLYGSADLAFVGGALHHEVHNVLEPAAFDLPLAFGPWYQNSHEASEIASKNFACIVRNEEDCLSWMKSAFSKDEALEKLRNFVRSKAGATDLMVNEIASYLSKA
jgi:3-deoxy-D-manno-octulosonic-acid transferase